MTTWRAVAVAVAFATQVFRVSTTVIPVNVSVAGVKGPVTGLRAEDFVVTDTGVQQTILSIAAEETPIDVTLVVDVSGSTNDELQKFRSSVTAMAAMLRRTDRVRLLGFASAVQEVSALTAAGSPMPVERLTTGDLSSIFDAVAVPLLRPTPPGRRHLIVAFTDGLENRSILTGQQLIAIAQRSDAVLHVVSPSGQLPVVPESNENDGAVGALRDSRLMLAAEATGGTVHGGSSMVDDFRKVLTEFRSGYVLTFRPTGVSSEGWHELAVRVKGGYRVQARRGYFAGPAGGRP